MENLNTTRFYVDTLASLDSVANEILKKYYQCKIFVLQGNLGAGKTTLVKSFATILGYKGIVSSPTFSIINEYATPVSVIYHMDLYRLESMEEALDIGIEEYLDSGSYCFIEWPEVIMPLLRDPFVRLNLSIAGENARYIDCVFYSD